LRHTGADGAAVDRARAFVRRRLAERMPDDPYTLALALDLLARDREAEALTDELWGRRHEKGKGVSFDVREKTPTYGVGKSGNAEATALAAQALLATPTGALDKADRAITYLLENQDTRGNWHSTQATIRSLKTLLAFEARRAQKGKGTLRVTVDGQ